MYKFKNIKTKGVHMSIISLIIICLSLIGLNQYYKDPDVSGRPLTSDEQRSLIDTQRSALLKNAKPIDIFNTLESRYEQLSPENKALAVELMYISQQNATLYYNNMMYIMGGEISVNRPNDSMNALDAGKKSAWIAGYIQDLKNQKLVPINLNEDMILALPDFNALEKYKSDATPSLRHLIEVGVKIQELQPYTDKYFDIYAGSLAFEMAMSKYQEIYNTNANDYEQHILSLARLMHDSIFGFLQTNNIEWQMNGHGDFNVSDTQLDGIKRLAESKLSLSDKAKAYLKEVEGKTISSDYISEKSLSSIKEFGQSVYISSAADIDNYYRIDKDGDLEPNNVPQSKNESITESTQDSTEETFDNTTTNNVETKE